jgi:hypothetical protein
MADIQLHNYVDVKLCTLECAIATAARAGPGLRARVGRQPGHHAERHRDALVATGADGTATFILGGQIAGEPADILLIDPEGNEIRASEERPFLQIGKSKCGKVHARAGGAGTR